MIPACLPAAALMPDAGHLFELFQMWTPDTATQQRILVSNPAKLYGFPN
jgi:predicted TIM-barrel fold metal-dependent hydrolase